MSKKKAYKIRKELLLPSAKTTTSRVLKDKRIGPLICFFCKNPIWSDWGKTDLGANARVILKRVQPKYCLRVWAGSLWIGIRTNTGYCHHGNEPRISVKAGGLDYQLVSRTLPHWVRHTWRTRPSSRNLLCLCRYRCSFVCTRCHLGGGVGLSEPAEVARLLSTLSGIFGTQNLSYFAISRPWIWRWLFFWSVTPRGLVGIHFSPEDGGSMFPEKVVTFLQLTIEGVTTRKNVNINTKAVHRSLH
jgi:hypothetical protein